MGLTGEIKLDVLGFRTSFHLDLIEKVSGWGFAEVVEVDLGDAKSLFACRCVVG